MGPFSLWAWEGQAGSFAKPASSQKGLVFEPHVAREGEHCRRACQWEPGSKVVPFRDSWEKILPAFSRAFSAYL